MTKEEIIKELKNIRVDTGENLPIKYIFFIADNEDYNPELFSQEIEDSELPVSYMDILKYNKRNSKEWELNHSKICKAKVKYELFVCYNHEDGIRDYNYGKNIERILKIQEKFGNLIKIF